MHLLSNLGTEGSRTLVVSLHAPEFARHYCQRMIGLRQGQILFDLPTEQVTASMLEELYQLEENQLEEKKVRGKR